MRLPEMWRAIPGYEGRYEVSDLGRIRSLPGRQRGRILKTYYGRSGYQEIKLLSADGVKRGFLVHRLVLETFVGPCPPGCEARHYPDNARVNCRLDNLSWATHIRNCQDRIDGGTQPRGEAHWASKLTESQVAAIAECSRRGLTQRAIAAQYGISQATVSLIVNRRVWAHLQ